MTKQNKPLARLGAALAASIVGGAGLLLAGPAMAQGQMRGGDTPNSATAKLEAQESSGGLIHDAFNYVKNNSYFRVGVLHFQYHGDSSNLVVEDAQGLAAQAFGPGRQELESTGSSTGNTTVLGGTFGLFIPHTGRHLATEVTLAPPLKLDFEVSKNAIDESLAPTALNGENGESIPTGVPPLGRSIGTLKALPPNFTIVYRPWVDTMIQPYIGAGAMYLYTFDTDVSNSVLNSVGEPVLNLSKPVACVGQLGFDVFFTDKIFLSADAKYVGCAEVEAKLNNIQVDSPNLSPTFGPVDVGTVSSTNEFKAMLYQISFGMRF